MKLIISLIRLPAVLQWEALIYCADFWDVRNPFYADIAFHMQKQLEMAGYMVMTFNSEYDTAEK
jgi:DNA-binding LacI/PurR family transcriptional regulator